MTMEPMIGSDSIHWLWATVLNPKQSMASQKTDDYNTWHNRFGYPGKIVLHNASNNINGLPKISIPSEDMPCRGCALGKAAAKAYPKSEK